MEHLIPLNKDDNSKQEVEIELDNCNPPIIPDTFNNYFANVGLDLKQKIKDLSADETIRLAEGKQHLTGIQNPTDKKRNVQI